MTSVETKRRGAAAVAVVALVVVGAAAVSAGRREEADGIPAGVTGWYGAMQLYRAVAMWAGKRAMDAELNYWKATTR